MQRRTFVTFLAAVGAAACASRGTTSAVQSVDIRNVALLAIKEWEPVGDTAGPFDPTAIKSPDANAAIWPFHSLGLSRVVAEMARSSRTAAAEAAAESRRAISLALRPIGIQPRQDLTAALERAFAKRNLPITLIADEAASKLARRRTRSFAKLPPGFDAVLDVQINPAGYFKVTETGGYSPMFFVSAQLFSIADTRTELEAFSYEADYRDAEGERRFFTTPKTLSVDSLDEIAERAPVMRSELLSIIDQIANMISSDIERALNKLPRLD